MRKNSKIINIGQGAFYVNGLVMAKIARNMLLDKEFVYN
jgi:hypothetical protein